MSIFGSSIRKVIQEKDVPIGQDNADYDLEDEEAPAGKDVTTGDDGEDYDLPEEDEEAPTDDDTDYDLEDDEEPADDEEPGEDTGDEEPADDEGYDLPEGDEEGDDTGEDIGDEGDPADTGDEEALDGEETDEEADTTEELFSDLTPEQKVIRDKKLVKLYSNLYNTVSDYLSKLDKIPRTGFRLQKIEFISDSVSDLKDMIYDYIIASYKTKSYLENLKNYYGYIAAFDRVNKLVEELNNADLEKK